MNGKINLINKFPEKEESVDSKPQAEKAKPKGKAKLAKPEEKATKPKDDGDQSKDEPAKAKKSPADKHPPPAHITEWCIDNRVLFHPLTTRLDHSQETTIDTDVLEHLRNTILRPKEVPNVCPLLMVQVAK